MSRGLANTGPSGIGNSGGGFRGLRDYGATSSGHTSMAGPSTSSNVTDVTFAGFSPTEFMSLSESIAQNIGAVKSSWHSLEKAIKIIGGPKDTTVTRDKVWVIDTCISFEMNWFYIYFSVFFLVLFLSSGIILQLINLVILKQWHAYVLLVDMPIESLQPFPLNLPSIFCRDSYLFVHANWARINVDSLHVPTNKRQKIRMNRNSLYFYFFLNRHQIQSTTNAKIQTTSKDLQRLTVVVRHGDKQQRLQVEKLTSDFRNVVEFYSKSQKVTNRTIIFLYYSILEDIWLARFGLWFSNLYQNICYVRFD